MSYNRPTKALLISAISEGNDSVLPSFEILMAIIRTHDWTGYLHAAKMDHRLNFHGEPIMSNQFSASFGAAPVRAADKVKLSFWRRVFNAWLQSYSNRVDPDGCAF